MRHRNANLTIERGDKVAFVGKNGEGKSTLVKCIMKEIEHDGTLTLGHNVQIGYFAQNQASLMDENLTVFQTIDDVAKGDIRNKIRDLLGAFMFGGPEESMKNAVSYLKFLTIFKPFVRTSFFVSFVFSLAIDAKEKS